MNTDLENNFTDFKKLFDFNKEITLEYFINNLKINYKNKIYNIKEFELIKTHKDLLYNVKQFYIFFIENKEDKLKRMFKSFENKNIDLIKLYDIKKDKIINKKKINNAIGRNSKCFIKNIFFKDIIKETTGSRITLYDFYKDLEVNLLIKQSYFISDKYIHYLLNDRQSINLKMFHITSVINPLTLYSIFNKYVKENDTILNPCMSWLCPLYVWLKTKSIKYIGIDVIEDVINKGQLLFDKYNIDEKKSIDLYLSPSEDLLNNNNFIFKYLNNVDYIFFCPPYYDYEIYKGDLQSTNRYKTLDLWLNNYWEKTIKLCYICLKKDKKLMYIIGNCDKKHNLVEKMNEITLKYFNLIDEYNFVSSNSSHKNTENNEKLFIFTKK